MSKSIQFTVIDPVGLYAIPVTELVNTVKQFYSYITLTYNHKKVNLKSLMGVLSLGVPTQATVEITAEGEDESRAIDIISQKLNELQIAHI